MFRADSDPGELLRGSTITQPAQILDRGQDPCLIEDRLGSPTSPLDRTLQRTLGRLAESEERRRLAEYRLEHDALHDALTGLPNKASLIDRLAERLDCPADTRRACVVLLLDVDRFTLVNDSLGHTAGDQLLIELAHRLSTIAAPGDTLGRIGDDQFILVLERASRRSAAVAVADRVLRALQRPFQVERRKLYVTASIGIALCSGGDDACQMLRNAAIAMNEAKRTGRRRWKVYDDRMHRRVLERFTHENSLREALATSLLRIDYQPIVELATDRITAFEALARWPAQWRQVEPAQFIPIAEDTGLIDALGQHVMRVALGALSSWRRAGLVGGDVCMSVNVSTRQLEDPTLPAKVSAALECAEIPPEVLRLEITESALMREPELILSVIGEICATGVRLHLDDFGTGYSSLGALRRLPVSALKIDRSFLMGAEPEDRDADAILRSTVALAHSLELPVVAEGIETPGQLRRMRALGCDFGQGFLFSRPADAERTRTLLARWPRAADPVKPE